MFESPATVIGNPVENNEIELQQMIIDNDKKQAKCEKQMKLAQQSKIQNSRFSTNKRYGILFGSFLLLCVVAISSVAWVPRHSSNAEEAVAAASSSNVYKNKEEKVEKEQARASSEAEDESGENERVPQLRSYTGYHRRGPDSLGYMNLFVQPEYQSSKRPPRRIRFPVARYENRRIPLNGPFLHLLPRIPVFVDRFTKQTIIFSQTGGYYIVPPLINAFGRMFSVGELIVSGYASLAGSGSLPPASINMFNHYLPIPLIGAGLPAFDPLFGGFRGGVRTDFGSFSVPRSYYKESRIYTAEELEYGDDSESESYEEEEDDYYPSSGSYGKYRKSYPRPYRRTTTTVRSTTITTTRRGTTTTTTRREATTTTTTRSETTSTTTTGTPNTGCGTSSLDPSVFTERIIGGENAALGEFPWIVLLLKSNQFICGGTLITPQHVLTAAHCVDGEASANQFTVRVGILQRSAPGGESGAVISVSIHPGWNSTAINGFDIAILTLASAFTASSTINKVCLPPADRSIPTSNSRAIISGWGKTVGNDRNSIADDLQKGIIRLGDSPGCTSSERIVCAPGQTPRPCNGDSGGPLVANVDNRWTIVGINSFAVVNCTDFSGFTRVSNYIEFINSIIKP